MDTERDDGEIMALEWKDIDFVQKTMRIERTSQFVKGIGIITKTTKTDKSRRIVDLSDYCMNLLKSYKVWQLERRLRLGDIWKYDTDRLFTQESRTSIFSRCSYYVV